MGVMGGDGLESWAGRKDGRAEGRDRGVLGDWV